MAASARQTPRSLIDDPRLVWWFDRKCGRMSFQEARREPAKPLKRYGGGFLNLDTSEFGVTNVFEAAELFERLLGYRTDGVDIRLVHNVPARLALIARRLSARLRSADSIAIGRQTSHGRLHMNASFWRDRRVFVTGHTGFKGSWLCLILERLGTRCSALRLPRRQVLASLRWRASTSGFARLTGMCGDSPSCGRQCGGAP